MKKILLSMILAAGASALYLALAQSAEEARMARPLPGAARDAGGPVERSVLLDDVRTLASDAFEGRRTGTAGSHRARAYLRERFGAIGLLPFGADYLQPFAFSTRSVANLFTPGRPYRTAYADAANIVGYIRGSAAPQRYLVVSAHYDHLGVRGGKLYPGADDNASGVAAMLAIASYFKAHPPRHSVLFAAFDAEELGLQGARAFVAAPPVPRAQLRANLNLDMLAHNDSNEIFVAGTYPWPALKPLLAQAAARSSVRVLLGHDRPLLAAGLVESWNDSSDHAPFNEAGIPFLYFGVADHADYHAPSDTYAHINAAFFVRVSNLLVDVAARMERELDSISP
ncbi:M20/M25/M40 family metallo-hydrolase [Janthinobacterium fluminis]|uniref:M28 family peptidase n=1 Tax=Janthinobacterium fluminis TaxID=2987524 RepID=A0ABT5K460_9BURK|nr:M20/M25/M40 family metallo-hydrolase [Janthinobacterium fluminis]MDC8759480.1 M28 family peptidase [Janthinobacterium fluminis]